MAALADVVAGIVDGVIATESGYVNHPSDRGGPTKFGITEAVARANGYTRDMRDLSIVEAREILAREYVRVPGFDLVMAVSLPIGAEVADSGVNCGQTRAARWLQEWLTAFNRQGRDYPDLKPDGIVGLVTVKALRAFVALRGAEGERVLLHALNCTQGAYYLSIAEGRPANEDFLYGWVRARIADQLDGR